MSLTTRRPAASVSPARSEGAVEAGLQSGLTSGEARRALGEHGPNAMPDISVHPVRLEIA